MKVNGVSVLYCWLQSSVLNEILDVRSTNDICLRVTCFRYFTSQTVNISCNAENHLSPIMLYHKNSNVNKIDDSLLIIITNYRNVLLLWSRSNSLLWCAWQVNKTTNSGCIAISNINIFLYALDCIIQEIWTVSMEVQSKVCCIRSKIAASSELPSEQ